LPLAGWRDRQQNRAMIGQRELLKSQIRNAFANTPPPDPSRLRGSNEGEEPYLLEDEFREVPDWRTLEAGFLDQSPDGFASALSFFSDQAFRYYLPAFLLADLDEQLSHADPLFHLWHGLDDEKRDQLVNPRRYGELTWLQAISRRFGAFTAAESVAIVAYMRFEAALDDFVRPNVEQALRNFWLPKLGHE
jgi:hypothetical protein